MDEIRNVFSSSAFRTIDGTRRIVGKFVEIEPIGDGWDIWIVRPDREPIGTRKLNNLVRCIEALSENHTVKPTITKLDGEAYLYTTSRELMLRVGLYTGVKRRKRYSEATRQARIAQLARYRKAG